MLPAVCILAGGLGTRLGEVVRDTPKPLLTVAGEPFLFHQLRLLSSHGARTIVLSVGYLGEQIEAAVGHERFGLTIAYCYDGPAPIGTLGAIRKAAPLLGDRFLVLYGDTYLRLDYARAAAAWEASRHPGLMTVLHNDGQWDASNVVFDGAQVTLYDKRTPTADMEWIDYGLGGLRTDALGLVDDDVGDLAELYHVLSMRSELFGFAADQRFYEIGSPAALAETDRFLTEIRSEG